jgi:uncharacterized LabA/DUF88 family protein
MKKNALMFVDFENFFYALKNNHHYEYFDSSHLLKIMNYLRSNYDYEIIYSAIYADWGQLPQEFQTNCARAGCNPIYVSCHNYLTNLPKKEVVDKNIIIDCMEWLLLRGNAFDVLILVSGDHDFLPLVDKFMNYGKDVIVGPVKATGNTEMIETATSTFFIDDVLSEELELCRSEYKKTVEKGITDIKTKLSDRPVVSPEVNQVKVKSSTVHENRINMRKIVERLDECERKMPFVSLTYFRDKILPEFLNPRDVEDFNARKNLMIELIASPYFAVKQIYNPKKPEIPTSVIGVNKNNSIIWQWYPEYSVVTEELKNQFDSQDSSHNQ